MRFLKLILIVSVFSLCCSATACLNDSELADHEREFRSQYLRSQINRDSAMTGQDQAWLMAVTGIALFAGAIALTWLSNR